jgi:hypothetical protein
MTAAIDLLLLARRRLEEIRSISPAERGSGGPPVSARLVRDQTLSVIRGREKSEISEQSTVAEVSSVLGPPLGEAGPGIDAWHCRIDLGTGHVRGTRPDGSSYCATCHPSLPSARPQ